MSTKEPIFKSKGALFFIVAFAGFYGWVMYANRNNPPQKRDTETQIISHQNAEREQRLIYANLCRKSKICQSYAAARQQCAAAGDFNNCIYVKTGEGIRSLSEDCLSDGSVITMRPQDVPGSTWCYISSWVD